MSRRHAYPTVRSSRVLEALYRLSGEGDAGAPLDASGLGRALGVSPTRAAEALVRLEHLGLVDAARARLTLRGLAVAAALVGGAPPARLDLGERAA
jgi:DNA-binding GntR family transcriptional regulator